MGFKLPKNLLKVLFPKKKKSSTNDRSSKPKSNKSYNELVPETPLKSIPEDDDDREQKQHLLEVSPADSTPGTVVSSFSYSDETPSSSPSSVAVDKCVGEDVEGHILTVSLQCDSFDMNEAEENCDPTPSSSSPSSAALDKCVGEDAEGHILTVSLQCGSFDIDEAEEDTSSAITAGGNDSSSPPAPAQDKINEEETVKLEEPKEPESIPSDHDNVEEETTEPVSADCPDTATKNNAENIEPPIEPPLYIYPPVKLTATIATQTDPNELKEEEDEDTKKYIGVARMRRKMLKEQQARRKKNNVKDDVPPTPPVPPSPPPVTEPASDVVKDVDETKSFKTIVFYENSPQKPSKLFEGNSPPSSPKKEVAEVQVEESVEQLPIMDEEAKELASALKELIDGDGFPVAQDKQASDPATTTAGDSGDNNSTIQFFILLLCPKSRIFELIEITDAPKNSTISDVLHRIPAKVTDERLLEKHFTGFCRPTDRTEFMNPEALAFQTGDEQDDWIATDSIRDDDVLVAILKGHSGYEMSKISKPILRNSKFKDMIRRRRRSNHQRSRKRSNSITSSCSRTLTQDLKDCDDISFMGEMSIRSSKSKSNKSVGSKRSVTSRNVEKEEEYSSLCKKLEDLSKKLNNVDDEIMLEENPSGGSAITKDTSLEEQALDAGENYSMSPSMVAFELAQNIEEIFAGHDVEILAVDADGGEEETDDDTFMSARSRRSVRSLVLGFDSKPPLLGDKPFEITTKKRPPRKSRRSQFDSHDDNALALQIEAMAAEADAAFERRHIKEPIIATDTGAAIVMPTFGLVDESTGENNGIVSQVEALAIQADTEYIKDDEAVASVDGENDTSIDLSKAMAMGEIEDVSNYSKSQKEALSRNFLNTSTNMVSTLVAASQGRVNEVHVLQYLGVTIVCIAANMVQQTRQAGSPTAPFGAKEVFQSAMFLAFMVNGQRYLARVTKKDKKDVFV